MAIRRALANALVDRPQPERRPRAESLGRRAVAEDQLPDRVRVVRALERFGPGGEGPIADLDRDRRVRQQVAAPGVIGPVRRDQEGAIRLGHEPDDDARARRPLRSAAGGQPGDPPIRDEVVVHAARRDGQRARCQDLPSVWVDGA